GPDHHREVAWVLGEEEDQPISDRLPYELRELREKVARALVEEIVRRIQTQTVQVILREPAKCVLEEEGAHLVTLFAIEIDGRPPESLVAIREVIGGELGQVIAVGAEMVVDDVEEDGQSQPVRFINQVPEVIRPPVASCRGEQAYAVVAPVPAAGEVGHGHELDRGHAQPCKLRKPAGHPLEGSLGRERADVQLVDDQALARGPLPAPIGPGKPGWIHDLGWSVDSLGLESRSWIGEGALTVQA